MVGTRGRTRRGSTGMGRGRGSLGGTASRRGGGRTARRGTPRTGRTTGEAPTRGPTRRSTTRRSSSPAAKRTLRVCLCRRKTPSRTGRTGARDPALPLGGPGGKAGGGWEVLGEGGWDSLILTSMFATLGKHNAKVGSLFVSRLIVLLDFRMMCDDV